MIVYGLWLVAAVGIGATTLSQSMFAKGRLAGQRLLEQIDGSDSPPATTLLPVKLVLRATTAPPPRVMG